MAVDLIETYKDAIEHMGKLVFVRTILKRCYKGNDRIWRPKPIQPRAGWLVGWRRLQNGHYIAGWGGEEDYEPPYLEYRSSVPALLVTWWPTQKPATVQPAGCRLARDMDPAPYASMGYGEGPERERALLAVRRQARGTEHAEPWPRDDRGRWKKP